MLISQLPKDLRDKAQQNQLNEKDVEMFKRDSDCLGWAFDWEETDEGYEFWEELYRADNPNALKQTGLLQVLEK